MTGPLSSQRLDEIAAHVPNCRYGCEACEAFPALAEEVKRLRLENEQLSDLDAATTRRAGLQAERDRAVACWHEERKHAAEAECERGRLRNALTVIRMIVEESATNDADLLRQAILEQLPASLGVGRPQPGPHRHADAPAAGLATTETQPYAQEPQEAAENCAHCGKPRNGYGNYLGAKVCHSGTVPPQSDPIDCYRLLTVYGEPIGSRMAKPTPPACPDCGMPETNCACG